MILRVYNLKKYYGNKGGVTKALDGIDFEIDKGEFVGIMGPSGSGKTSLLNIISTIDIKTQGKVYIEDTDIDGLKEKELTILRREKLGFIFQHFSLIDSINVYDNIALSQTMQNRNGMRNRTKNDFHDKLITLSNKLGISKILDKFPYEISGGEKSRVASARALLKEPSIILADEPTGSLDSKSSGDFMHALSEINKEVGTTILMVTHDAWAASFTNRILFIRDGKIFDEITRGEDSRVKFFERIINVMTYMGGNSGE